MTQLTPCSPSVGQTVVNQGEGACAVCSSQRVAIVVMNHKECGNYVYTPEAGAESMMNALQ